MLLILQRLTCLSSYSRVDGNKKYQKTQRPAEIAGATDHFKASPDYQAHKGQKFDDTFYSSVSNNLRS